MLAEHATAPKPSARAIDYVQFLFDRGRLDAETAEAVRKRAEIERTPIGQIFVMQGLLSVRQVMNLLAIQADTPGTRFGELAVKVGYLNTVQLEAALNFQRTHLRHQIEIVHLEKILPKPDLDSTVVAYVAFLELQASE